MKSFADNYVTDYVDSDFPLQILFLPKSLKRPLLPMLGQLSVVHTETLYTRNVKPGRQRSSLSALHLVDCGNRSTP